ncbi:MAG: hypothetical protein FWE13_00755 [Firmicutes bacterium]|nr:hypothetical protein [Bacillota bacterium]
MEEIVRLEIWAIIISVISAIATFSAVLVALWNSKQHWKKNIYMSFINNAGVINEKNFTPEFLEIILFNAGNVKIALSSIFLNSKKENSITLPFELEYQLWEKPYILDIGETLMLNLQFDIFISSLKGQLKTQQIKENKPIVFLVEELSGKTFKFKITHTPLDYLNWEKGEVCLFPKIIE